MLFDVAIPVHEKDLRTLDFCIASIKKNVVGFRNIYIISKKRYTKNGLWVDESKFPFAFKEVQNLSGNISASWCFQQLLKLYSPLSIKNSLPNILIIDSDTIFYKKTTFFENNIPLYNLSKDLNLYNSVFQIQTCNHISTLVPKVKEKLPELYNYKEQEHQIVCKKFHEKLSFLSENDKNLSSNLISPVCHHMIFQKKVIECLFKYIEKKNNNEQFYKVFLKSFNNFRFVSEYSLYFYFLITFFPNSYKIRILKYKNSANLNPLLESLRKKYDYCSYHSYMARDSLMLNIINNFYRKIAY